MSNDSWLLLPTNYFHNQKEVISATAMTVTTTMKTTWLREYPLPATVTKEAHDVLLTQALKSQILPARRMRLANHACNITKETRVREATPLII